MINVLDSTPEGVWDLVQRIYGEVDNKIPQKTKQNHNNSNNKKTQQKTSKEQQQSNKNKQTKRRKRKYEEEIGKRQDALYSIAKEYSATEVFKLNLKKSIVFFSLPYIDDSRNPQENQSRGQGVAGTNTFCALIPDIPENTSLFPQTLLP